MAAAISIAVNFFAIPRSSIFHLPSLLKICSLLHRIVVSHLVLTDHRASDEFVRKTNNKIEFHASTISTIYWGRRGGKAANRIKKRIDFTRFEHWLGKRTRARITSPVRGYRSGVWILVIRIAFRSNRSASRLRSTQPFLYRAKEISTFSSRSSPLYNNYKMTRDDLRLDCDQSFYTVAYTW